MQPTAKIVYDSTKILIGIIEGSSIVENRVSYRVFLEGYHSDETNPTIRSIGIHVSQAGAGRYAKKSRVLCLIRNNDYGTCFIIGKIGDPFSSSSKTLDPSILNEGNQRIGSSKSGMFAGENTSVIFSGSSSISVTQNSATIDIGKYKNSITKTGLLFQNDSGIIALAPDKSTFFAERDMYIMSKSGKIDMTAGFIHLSSNGGKMLIDKISDLKISAGKTILSSGYIKIVGSSAAAYSEGSSAIDINSLEGDIAINVGKGDLPIVLLDPTSKFSIDVGYPLALSSFSMDGGDIELKNLLASFNVTKLGKVTIDNKFSTIEMASTGKVDVKNTVGGRVTITPTGFIEIKGSAGSLEKSILGESLVGLLGDLIDELSSATVVTAFGPYPFSPSVIGKLKSIKAQLKPKALSLSVKNS